MKYCISVRGPKLWNKFLQSKKGNTKKYCQPPWLADKKKFEF